MAPRVLHTKPRLKRLLRGGFGTAVGAARQHWNCCNIAEMCRSCHVKKDQWICWRWWTEFGILRILLYLLSWWNAFWCLFQKLHVATRCFRPTRTAGLKSPVAPGRVEHVARWQVQGGLRGRCLDISNSMGTFSTNVFVYRRVLTCRRLKS